MDPLTLAGIVTIVLTEALARVGELSLNGAISRLRDLIAAKSPEIINQLQEISENQTPLPETIEAIATLVKDDPQIREVAEQVAKENGSKPYFDLIWETLDENSQNLAMHLSLFALAPFSQSLINGLLGDHHPDDIEEWFVDNLVNLNLVNDLGNNWYELHTLIRDFLKKKLEESVFKVEAKRAYCKIMVVIAKDIQETLTLADITRLKPYIDHLKIAAEELNEWLEEEDLIWPFIGLCRFYEAQGFYQQAAPYREQCLTVSEKRLGENHPSVANSLNNLATLYQAQRRYTEAEPLYLRSVSIKEQELGKNHPFVATSLNNLATLYQAQRRYTEAEPLYLRSVSIKEQELGKNHPSLVSSLNNLASLYQVQGKFQDAESLYERALSICEQELGKNHPDMASSLHNLAGLYQAQGRYEDAESAYELVLSIDKQQLRENHPDVASSLHNLAGLYKVQGRYEDAEPLYERALFKEQYLGENHPYIVTSLKDFGNFYYNQSKYAKAEPLYERALFKEQYLGENHPDVAIIIKNLHSTYRIQDKYTKAELLYKPTLPIKEKYNNVLVQYQMGQRYFEGKNLRGQCFKGANLSGANFSRCDIKGTNFKEANLTGAKFIGAKAGLQKRWQIVLLIIVYFLLLLSNLFLIGLITLALEYAKNALELIFILIVIVPLVVVGSVTVVGSVAFAVAFAVVGARSVALIGVVALVGALVFAGSGSLALGLALAWNILIYYVVNRTMKGDIRDSWLRNLAITFAAIGGTSFYNATLTDANFGGASLGNTDLRAKLLTRNCFKDALKLNLARVGP
ncbi:tetratricopeptide repeat protein [Cylindrospermopsis curvispora]|uniref:Tetratricopeptide repeat protein n=1 Tax=Cylindrospermopsis curvispora GIHE-G1 TaxID=2666332 RepID=A0A7H0EZL9_9CYAN|nr:tetratricopeptide repeat protein [Cylindrospermopsis curvispora]QNP29235.1 tetratricopeptide repeat protein [Cylindrospermopsis curvispora GIHE-G1]